MTKLSEHLTSSSAAALSHSSELDGLRLTPHFSLEEMCKTKVNLENVPNEAQVENLKRLCGWLEMLRSEWNKRYGGLSPDPSLSREGSRDQEEPIIINSGYRSAAVHLTGCAADIRVAGIEQLVRYATILLDISDESQEDFDELLLERSPRGGYWLHFAVRPSGNRRKVRLIQT